MTTPNQPTDDDLPERIWIDILDDGKLNNEWRVGGKYGSDVEYVRARQLPAEQEQWIACADCGNKRAYSTLASIDTFVCRYCLGTNPAPPLVGEELNQKVGNQAEGDPRNMPHKLQECKVGCITEHSCELCWRSRDDSVHSTVGSDDAYAPFTVELSKPTEIVVGSGIALNCPDDQTRLHKVLAMRDKGNYYELDVELLLKPAPTPDVETLREKIKDVLYNYGHSTSDTVNQLMELFTATLKAGGVK